MYEFEVYDENLKLCWLTHKRSNNRSHTDTFDHLKLITDHIPLGDMIVMRGKQ